jgi:hypothetical protein
MRATLPILACCIALSIVPLAAAGSGDACGHADLPSLAVGCVPTAQGLPVGTPGDPPGGPCRPYCLTAEG